MGDRTKVLHNETQDKSDLPPAAGQAHAARLNGVNRFAPRGAGAWAALARSGLLPACKKWRSRRASCWLTLTSFTTRWTLVKCGVRNGERGMQNGLAQPMPWLAYSQGGNRKASDRRLVQPTLRGALLGLEIGTSQSTLPVGAGQYGKTPHIALFGAFLALHASDCRYVVCQREGCEKALFPGRIKLRLGG